MEFNIPKNIQLEAITQMFISDSLKILEPYIKKKSKKIWDRKKLKKYFSINLNDLEKYLENKMKICNEHYTYSLNKRSGGAYIYFNNKKYLVGSILENGEDKIYIKSIDLPKAVAYFLFLEYGLIE